MLGNLKNDLVKLANGEKAAFFPKFFKTGKGQYGEGDIFLGVTVPNQKKVARKYCNLTLSEIKQLLKSPIHEHRLTALFILVLQFEKTFKEKTPSKAIVDFYIDHLDYVNNWDLVDSSAGKILGIYLLDKDRSLLYELAHSSDLWRERVAIIATQPFIKRGDFQDTLKIARILLEHKHDLIHKAVGWMLREVGKLNRDVLEKFLQLHYQKMPRTMLRYAIEKFSPEKRLSYLKGKI